LIAEEAPVEVLSAEKGGVDLYKLAAFTLGGLKALDKKVADLEMRLEDLEITGTAGGDTSPNGVLKYLASLGAKITDSIAYFKNIVTGTLTIGSKDKPTGITLYDEVTGEPYCLSIANGATKTHGGVCDEVPPDSENQVESIKYKEDDQSSSEDSGAVGDTEPPTIELRGNNPITLDKNARFLDPGVSLSDNETQDIHIRLETTGDDIDTSVPGTYTISYKATDLAGNSSMAERTVEVTDPQGSVIPDEIRDPSESVDVSESIRDPEESETSQNTPNNSSDSTGQVETEPDSIDPAAETQPAQTIEENPADTNEQNQPS